MDSMRAMSLGDRDRGAFLRVTVGGDSPWQKKVAIEIVAHPWSGTLEGTLDDEALRHFTAALRSPELPRRAVLGGDRSPELELKLAPQQGWPAGTELIAAEARAAWTGDDPFPELRWLMFDIEPAQLSAAADALEGPR